MHHKIDSWPFLRQRFKRAVEIGHVGHIAINQEIASKLRRQWPHPLFHHFALIAEGQFGTFGVQALRNAPCKRLVIGKPHNQPTFARHQSGHNILIRQVKSLAHPLVHFHVRWPAPRSTARQSPFQVQ